MISIATGTTVSVYRLRQPISHVRLNAIIDLARSEIGTQYFKAEAIRTVLGGSKPRSRRQFCSRLVARAFAARGVQLVGDPDYCSPRGVYDGVGVVGGEDGKIGPGVNDPIGRQSIVRRVRVESATAITSAGYTTHNSAPISTT